MEKDFQEILDRYRELREDFEADRIDEEEFQEEIEGLQVKDEQGRYWTIGAQSGKWYRYDGREWLQETPIPMTKHQGRGIPELVMRQSIGEGGMAAVPRWAYIGCSGLILLAVLAVVIVGGIRLMEGRDRAVADLATPTLGSGVPVNTPTPGPTPVSTPTTPPTATQPTFKVYSNSSFGLSVKYPGDWQAKESNSQVVLAPSSEGLNTSIVGATDVSQVAFVIGAQPGTTFEGSSAVLDQLKNVLPTAPGAVDTGQRTVGGVTWAIGQVSLNSEDPENEMIAYIAATLFDGTAYTVLAASPTSEWNSLATTFQEMFDSIEFAKPVAAANTPTPAVSREAGMDEEGAEGSIAGSGEETPEATPTLEATPEPEASPTPFIYIVQSGDTLGAIAMRFDVSVEDIQDANDMDDPGSLRIGQELFIPGATATTGSGAQPATPEAEANAETEGEGETGALLDATPTITGTETIAGATPEETATPAAAEAAPGEEVPLTGKIVYPVFVPDRMIGGQPGSYDVWMSDPQGTNQEVLVYDASQPSLNIGGDLLAYRSWASNARGIAFLTIGGGRGGLLTSFVEDALPDWDPSSITLVFPSRREGDRVSRLFRVSQATGDEYALGAISEHVSTFPNGGLVFKGCTVEGACGIYTASSEGGQMDLLTDHNSDTAPAPSPDGTKVAFMSIGRDGAGNYEIYVVNTNGSGLTRLTQNEANDGLPAWSPDGNAIAFVSDRDGTWGVWAMNPDGSNQRKLFTMKGSPDGIVGSEVNISHGWLEERLSWGP